MPRRYLLTLAFSLTLLVAASAQATPITYVHTGAGSGTLAGQSFGALAPLAFTITAVGDTDNIASCGGACLYNDNTSASITTLAMVSCFISLPFFTSIDTKSFSVDA